MELKIDPKKVKDLRLNKSWSQEDLAEQAALSLRTIQRIELDGSASLKSRRAIADALEVEPAYLDPQVEEPIIEIDIDDEDIEDEAPNNFWKDLLAYPGPSTISSKILNPLLITLWLGMLITGGILLLATGTITVISIVSPNVPFGQVFIATLPLLIIFATCLGLYQFFRRFSSTSSH
jgi:transcriptional regulator with XRE-family HTH domain